MATVHGVHDSDQDWEVADMNPERLEQMSQQVMDFVTTYGIAVIGAVLILIAGRIAASIAGKLTRRALGRANVDPALIGFASSIIKTAIIVFTVIAALAKFGVQTTSFVAVLGAAGLAIGLALQGSLSNFAAGVLILLFRPFRIGDAVEAAGVAGSVNEIGILTTTLRSWDNKKIIVPNSAIMSGVIVNINAHDTRRVDMTAGISYGDDIGRAKSILDKILADHPKVLDDPAPKVAVVELADSSVNFVVRPWCKSADYWDVYFEVTRAIKEQFDAQGISIPFPQRDVHVYSTNGAASLTPATPAAEKLGPSVA
jgi:small conductance mechanosensitive channel